MSNLIAVIDATGRQKVNVGGCWLRRQEGASWEYHPADGTHESTFVIWDEGILPYDCEVAIALGCGNCQGPALFYIGDEDDPELDLPEAMPSAWAWKGEPCPTWAQLTCQMCGVPLAARPTRTEGGLIIGKN
tara:strand:- start:78 stop:473 length:396 start_codon:yes stop_codon:yes gene_type:complete